MLIVVGVIALLATMVIGVAGRIDNQAKEKGVKCFSMMLLEAVEPEKVARIYEACGYTQAERTFLKVL